MLRSYISGIPNALGVYLYLGSEFLIIRVSQVSHQVALYHYLQELYLVVNFYPHVIINKRGEGLPYYVPAFCIKSKLPQSRSTLMGIRLKHSGSCFVSIEDVVPGSTGCCRVLESRLSMRVQPWESLCSI